MNCSPKISGFTLVEIAIVMVVVGLLIGGILKGQELIRTAQAARTISDVKSYFSAAYMFKDKYVFFPGDKPDAKTAIPDCGAVCLDGNGDGIVGIQLFPATYDTIQSGVATLPAVETTMFWKHLSLAGFITGINTSASAAAPEVGVTHPASPVGGIFHVATIRANSNMSDVGFGMHFRLQGGFGRNFQNTFLSPVVAYEIDRKMDDGLPDFGLVNADAAATNCDSGGVYQTDGNGTCTLFFSYSN